MGVLIGAGLAVALLAVLGWRLFMNTISPRVDARRRAHDDGYFLLGCSTGAMSRYRRLNRHLPSSPRCKFCLAPFAGLGRLVGIKRSRKNPNFCSGCFEMAPIGGVDMEVGILFADIRGYTAWSEDQAPQATADALNRFYKVASDVLTDGDGLVDKLVGDEVMGLYLSVFPSLGDRTCEVMVAAAFELLKRMSDDRSIGEPLPVGIGLSFGPAHVGNVGVGEVKDSLKGKTNPVAAYSVSTPTPAPAGP